jgi:cyclohexanecarboxylate-CoA ligase
MAMLAAESFWQLIDTRAKATPHDRLAVDQQNREIRFGEFRDRALRTAGGLRELGIGSGQTVSWMLPTWIESLVLVAALSRLGAIQNPILPIYRERELRFIAKQCRPSLLITPGEWRGFDYAGMASEIAAKNPGMKTLVVDGGLPETDVADLPLPDPSKERAESNETRWLFYTSGTTADPKGVRHSDATLFAAAKGMSRALALRESDRVAFVFPVTHIGGIVWLQAALAHGCTQILIENFADRDTIPTLQEYGVTLAAAGTVFHEAYLDAQRHSDSPPLFPDVRAFPGGGAPKPPQLHYDLRREMGGVGIVSGYGSTEAPILTMSRIDDPSEKLAMTEGRVSLPDVDIRVVESVGVGVGVDEAILGPGKIGELRVRAPQLFRGYVDASLDRAAFDEDGYFRTGDLGLIDEDGHLIVTGRTKDIIIRKGENIPVREVEDLLYTHPRILEVAVIGLPDPKTGERCCAVVTCPDGEAAITLKQMKAFLLDQKLMIQRIPEQLEIVDHLPRNATGKISKHALRDRFGR